MIQLIKNQNIDKKRWDSVISSSKISYYYAFSWYLDAVSPNWCALVSTNYEQIMPLHIKYKFGFLPHLAHPPFAQQLGVFGDGAYSVDDFFEKIPRKFLKIDAQLHHGEKPKYIDFIERTNYIIYLDVPYNDLLMRYHKDKMRYSIRKSKELNTQIDVCEDYHQIIDLYLTDIMADKLKVNHQYYNNLYKVLDVIKANHQKIEGYVIRENGIIIAALIATHYQDQIAFLATYNNYLGRKRYGLYRLWDYFIEKYANSKKYINVQGTDHPTVGLFYKRFGAVEQKYYHHKKNIFNF